MKKMYISYYPKLSRKLTMFSAHSDITGTIEIDEDYLYFNANLLMFIKLKDKSFTIDIDDIKSVDKVTLNKILNFGVCITLNDDREFMFGSVKQNKLYTMITEQLKTEE